MFFFLFENVKVKFIYKNHCIYGMIAMMKELILWGTYCCELSRRVITIYITIVTKVVSKVYFFFKNLEKSELKKTSTTITNKTM
jgi:hypothetical protein